VYPDLSRRQWYRRGGLLFRQASFIVGNDTGKDVKEENFLFCRIDDVRIRDRTVTPLQYLSCWSDKGWYSPIVSTFFRSCCLMDRLTLSTQFFTRQYGPNNWNSYLGAYVSKMSPLAPISPQTRPNTCEVLGQGGNFKEIIGRV